MSKMSNLDLVLDEMITAGQKMIDAATALKEMFSDIAPAVRKIDTKTEKKEAPAPAPEVKKYSFQEVRGIMAFSCYLSPSVNPALWTNSHKAIFKHKKKGFPAANRTQ